MAKRYTAVQIVNNKVVDQWSDDSKEQLVSDIHTLNNYRRKRGEAIEPCVYSIEYQGRVVDVVRVAG